MARKLKVTKARARKALRELVEIFNLAGFASREPNATAFRDIVTALRGPDNDITRVKEETTEVIRRDIGISNKTSGLCVALPGCEIPLGYVHMSYYDDERPIHFVNHISRAVKGLHTLKVKS